MNNGLNSEEVNERIKNGQVNTQEDRMVQSNKEIWRRHILTYFNALNTVLLVIVLLTGQFHNALFYFTAIINTCMGTWQEIKARNLLNNKWVKTGGYEQNRIVENTVAKERFYFALRAVHDFFNIALDALRRQNQPSRM